MIRLAFASVPAGGGLPGECVARRGVDAEDRAVERRCVGGRRPDVLTPERTPLRGRGAHTSRPAGRRRD